MKKLLSLFIFCLLSCKSEIDYTYVKNTVWEYEKGFKIGRGDIVLFEKSQNLFVLKDDTIFYNGKPRALIKKLDKRHFQMTISSIDNKQTGFYRDEAESLQ
jgi:hypothetical protein